MVLSFCSFSSGSSGNCYIIKSKTTALLVDAGISAKKINKGLIHTATEDDQLRAILITHEHSDHIRSLSTLMKQKNKLQAYANEKTWEAIGKFAWPERKHCFERGKRFLIGDIAVKAFSVSHDAADPVGFSFFLKEKQISIITDTGYVSKEMLEEVRDADLLVLEANYDADMLKIGRYPWFLKQRIMGDSGHLSNELAAQTLIQVLTKQKKQRQILLAHLSRENNFPEMAFQTVKNILEEENYYIGKHVGINTILRDQLSAVYYV